MNLNERLRYAREQAGLTLKEVESRTDIGFSSLSEYENGRREPSVLSWANLRKFITVPRRFSLRTETQFHRKCCGDTRCPLRKKSRLKPVFGIVRTVSESGSLVGESVGASLPKFAGSSRRRRTSKKSS